MRKTPTICEVKNMTAAERETFAEQAIRRIDGLEHNLTHLDRS